MDALLTILAIALLCLSAVAGVVLYECARHERQRQADEEAQARMDDPNHEFTSK